MVVPVNPFLVSWTVLVLATLLSWWLEAMADGTLVGTAVLLVAFFKARMVLMVFMDIRAAPQSIRWVCETWVLLAYTALLATYWLTPYFHAM